MKISSLTIALYVLVLLQGCFKKDAEIEQNTSDSRSNPAQNSTPFYLSDFVDALTEEELNEVHQRRQGSVITPPLAVLSFKSEQSILNDLQQIMGTEEPLEPFLNPLIASFNTTGTTIPHIPLNADVSIFLFDSEDFETDEEYPFVLYISELDSSTNMTRLDNSRGGIYSNVRELIPLFREHDSSYLSLSSRSYETITIDIPIKSEYGLFLSSLVPYDESTVEFQPLIDIFLNTISEMDKVTLYIDLNPSAQRLICSFALQAREDTHFYALLNNLLKSSRTETGRNVQSTNAVEFTITNVNNSALTEFLRQQHNNSILIRLLMAYMNITTGESLSVTYIHNREETKINIIDLKPETATQFHSLIDGTLNHLQTRFSLYSRLITSYQIRSLDDNLYALIPPVFENNAFMQEFNKPIFFGYASNLFVSGNSREMVLNQINNIIENKRPEPSIQSATQMNPFSIVYSKTNFSDMLQLFDGAGNNMVSSYSQFIPTSMTSTLELKDNKLLFSFYLSTNSLTGFLPLIIQ